MCDDGHALLVFLISGIGGALALSIVSVLALRTLRRQRFERAVDLAAIDDYGEVPRLSRGWR